MDKRVFVLNDEVAVITCGVCGNSSRKSVAKFKGRANTIKVKCPCGNIFNVTLDFRQFYRKKTNLQGKALLLNNQVNPWLEITVIDLSWTGIGITLKRQFTFVVGDAIMVSFQLDDPKKSQLQKTAVVRYVKDNFLGCQFTEKEAYEKELGFYLRG